jgi:hypothetical protein
MHQQPVAAREGVQSLISYQAEGVSEETTHKPFTGKLGRGNKPTILG